MRYNLKKGFTLIELLAVIVLLAVIAIIAIPTILNVIESSKRGAAIDSSYGYIKAIEYQNSMSQINDKYQKIGDGQNMGVEFIKDKINLKGTWPTSGVVNINRLRVESATLCINSYWIVYDGLQSKIVGSCKNSKEDLEKSEISINMATNICSKSNMVTIIYPKLTDVKKQYRIDDGEWLDYKEQIPVTKNQTIYARVFDGVNESKTASLVILKMDNEKVSDTSPALSLSTTNPTKEIEVISRQTDNCGIDEDSLEYGISDTEEGEYNYQKSNIFSNLINNKVYYIKTRVNDIANNGLVESKSSSIKTGDFGTITITPSSSDSQKSKTMTITSTSKEILQYKVVSDSTVKQDWTDYKNAININWEATNTTPTYIYSRLTDGENYSSETSYTEVKIDRTSPTCGIFTGNSSWTKNNVTVKLSCIDSESGCELNTYNVKTFTTTTATANIVDYEIKDNVGNTKKCSGTVNVYVDKTAPTQPSISNTSGGNWTNQNVTVTASSSDSNSGISAYQYSYDATNWFNFANGNSDTWGSERAQTVYIRAVDKVGNVSSTNQTGIYIDKTAPTQPSISNTSGGNWTQQNVTITASSSDSRSGIGKYQYSYDTVNWNDFANGNSDTWVIERAQPVFIRAVDKVGNASSYGQTGVYIDRTPPTMWSRIDNVCNSNGSVTTKAWATDSLSGVDSFRYFEWPVNTSYSNASAWKSDWSTPIYLDDGWETIKETWTKNRNSWIYFSACDKAGNCTKSNDTSSEPYSTTEKYPYYTTVKVPCTSSSSSGNPSSSGGTSCRYVYTTYPVDQCYANGGKLCASGSSTSCLPASQNTPVCYKKVCS